jgi:hypothetical protein
MKRKLNLGQIGYLVIVFITYCLTVGALIEKVFVLIALAPATVSTYYLIKYWPKN